MPSSVWWRDLERRLADAHVTLEAKLASDPEIPAALFDSFVDNAIDNASDKAVREPGIEIAVRFTCDEEKVELAVCDTGSQVEESAAAHLFREPIERGSGLGIGLYQAARQAQQAGYRLDLARNVAGDVRFSLAKSAKLAGGED